MKPCKGCGELKVDPLAPARYDVLNQDWDADHEPMDPTVGPYCDTCFPETYTGKFIASQN